MPPSCWASSARRRRWASPRSPRAVQPRPPPLSSPASTSPEAGAGTSCKDGGVSVTAREIVLLGSTGSIGTQAIDIVRRNPDRFRVVGIGGHGTNVSVLAAQALELGVDVVGVAKASAVQD